MAKNTQTLCDISLTTMSQKRLLFFWNWCVKQERFGHNFPQTPPAGGLIPLLSIQRRCFVVALKGSISSPSPQTKCDNLYTRMTHSQQINVTSFLFIIVIPCIPPANNNCCLLQSEWPGIPACRLALNFPCYFLHIWHWWSKSSKSTQWHATYVSSIRLIFRAFSSSDWLIFQVITFILR